MGTRFKAAELKAAVAYIDSWLSYQQRFRQIPGLGVAIRWQGKTLLNRTYGIAHKNTPLTPQHLTSMASNTKMVTATALLQLQEAGLLQLKDKVITYLPWLEEHADKRWRKVTIEQLASHQAGIIRDGPNFATWDLASPSPDAARLQREVLDSPLFFNPGKQFKYSNYGFSLLGMIVEKASGLPYTDYVRLHIFAPLKLKNAFFEDDMPAARRITGYAGRFALEDKREAYDFMPWNAGISAAGLWSNAEDLARLVGEINWGDTLLGKQSREQLQRMRVKQKDPLLPGYALGLSAVSFGAHKLLGHSGGGIGFTSRSIIDPHNKLSIALYVSTVGEPLLGFAEGIYSIFDFFHKYGTASAELAPYNGRFVFVWNPTDFVPTRRHLFRGNPELLKPLTDANVLKRNRKGEFTLTDASGYHAVGEPIQLVCRNGKLVKVAFGGAVMRPMA